MTVNTASVLSNIKIPVYRISRNVYLVKEIAYTLLIKRLALSFSYM